LTGIADAVMKITKLVKEERPMKIFAVKLNLNNWWWWNLTGRIFRR
jgi:hypothetical protein